MVEVRAIVMVQLAVELVHVVVAIAQMVVSLAFVGLQ